MNTWVLDLLWYAISSWAIVTTYQCHDTVLLGSEGSVQDMKFEYDSWWILVPSCYPVEWRSMWEPTIKHQSYGCVSNLGFCPNHLEMILEAGHHSILREPNSQTHIQTLAPGWHEAVQTSPPDGRVTGWQNWHRGKPTWKGFCMICAYIHVSVRVLTTVKQVKMCTYIKRGTPPWNDRPE